MNRIDGLKGKKSLVIYLMAGDGGAKTTLEVCEAIADAGADLIEIGIPFSDPMADGVVIQKAGERSLALGTSCADVLKMVKRLREKINTPLAAMTYYNIIHAYGPEKFVDHALKAGLDAAIIPDLPFDEEKEFRNYAKARGFYLVYLVAPSNTPERAKKIMENSSGFVYYILQKGVTGARKGGLTGLDGLKALKKASDKPVFAGFGISEPSQAGKVLKDADGVIIGSAFVSLFEKYSNRKTLVKKAREFTLKFKKEVLDAQKG